MSSRAPKLTSKSDTKAFLSLAVIILTLFSIAFFHMEERRVGYQVYYLSKEFKKQDQIKRLREIELAKLSKPSHLMQIAKSRLTLRQPDMHQIIHIAGSGKDYSMKKTEN
jgi:cell division protein FtsL